MGSGPVICHLSFNHGAFDDRIYWKELVSLKKAGYQPVHIAVGTEASDFISKEGIRIIIIRRRKKSKVAWLNRLIQAVVWKGTTLEAIFHVARLVQAAVYHYHDLQLNALTRQLKALPQKPKVIYDAHEAYHLLMLELVPKQPWQQLYHRMFINRAKAWERSAAGFCDHIFVTDPYSLQYFSSVVPKVPVSLLHNYSYFLPDDGVLTPEYDIIYTGLMNRSRGIILILQAVLLLKKQFSGIKLLLIGPFEQEEFKNTVQTLVRESGLSENVCVHDPVPFSEIQAFYKKSRIGMGIFLPTPKYRTFIPIKLFEYMAFGLPVVFSDHGPSADLIRESRCGLLVDPLNPQAICHAITRLLNDEGLYRQMREAAKSAVAHRFNWDKEKEKLIGVYEGMKNG